MVMAVLSGQYDAQILRTTQPPGNHEQQQTGFGNAGPTFGFQTPSRIFPLPTMPPIPIPAIPGTYPPPPIVVPNMFPTTGLEVNTVLPNSQTTRTIFPGGEAIQQSSSYSGQHGNTTFQYSSSSTSMSFSPDLQHQSHQTPLPPIQYIPQPVRTTIVSPPPEHLPSIPAPAPAPSQPQPFMQRPLDTHILPQHQPQPQPQPAPHHVQAPTINIPPMQTPIVELPPTPEQIFHPTTVNQAPQNKRLADSFKRELSEATYFSDIPGMPDRSVQR